MKKIVCFLVCVFCVINTANAQDGKTVRVFIFAGQSNMVGSDANFNDIDLHPPFIGAATEQTDVMYSYHLGNGEPSNGWESMKPVGTLFGPEMTFARAFKKTTSDPIAIIKDAWGGTTLVNDWDPAGGNDKSKKLYARLQKHIKERLADLDNQGLKYKIEAVMWHQGENDMFDAVGKANYETNLRIFIASIRKDLGIPDLKFFIGEISNKGIWGMDNRDNVAKICVQQKAVIASDPNVYFVPTSHLGFKVGNPIGLHYHFGTLGQLQHGEEYFSHYLASINKTPTRTIRTYKNWESTKKVKLFILGGQRNMEGELAYVDDIKKYEEFASLIDAQEDVLFRYNLGGGALFSAQWEPLAHANYLGNFGPELSFAKGLKSTLPSDETLAIYKFTHSGAQSIDWIPEGGGITHRNLYQIFIGGIKQALLELKNRKCETELTAVFWHCGENDRSRQQESRMYVKNLKKLIDGLRKDLNAPQLPWYISLQPTFISNNENTTFFDVNAELEELAKSDQNIHLIKTDDIPRQPMLFGTEGILKLGQKMARAWNSTNQ